MQIIRTSGELNAVQIYNLVKNPETRKMRDVKGQRIELSYWAHYMDANKADGEAMEILAIATPEGETFATNSPTFINDFNEMVDLFNEFGQTVGAVEIIGGVSKAGRDFITCKYAG